MHTHPSHSIIVDRTLNVDSYVAITILSTHHVHVHNMRYSSQVRSRKADSTQVLNVLVHCMYKICTFITYVRND